MPRDRSSLLGSVSSTSLKPLGQMTKVDGFNVPRASRDFNSPHYMSMVPKLHLFLEKNRLQFLPGAVYNIRALTVISLRDNQLMALLPSIVRLSNVVELNLSNNCLRWLPWEVKAFMFDLRQLNVSGNPLVEPDLHHGSSIPYKITKEDKAFQMQDKNDVVFVAYTAVTLLNADGSARRGPAKPTPSMFHTSIRSSPTTVDVQRMKAYIPSGTPLPEVEHRSKVPSLMETVLRAASRQPSLYTMVANLPEDFPPTLSMLLRHTLRVKEAGGQECSVCCGPYIIPRTEWIEWWRFGRYQIGPTTPLLRFGCSWDCWARRENSDSA